MKITYTGQPAELLPKERLKLEGKLGKVAKVIEQRGEKEAHVILSQVRHLHKAEVTMRALDHSIVGIGSASDLVSAMSEAIENLEKQVLKLRTKRRDTHRHSLEKGAVNELAPTPAVAKTKPSRAVGSKKAVKVAAPAAKPKIFRIDHQNGQKPMTLEEATLEIGSGQGYVVYRDAKTDRVCTLLRRNDGHLDLIES